MKRAGFEPGERSGTLNTTDTSPARGRGAAHARVTLGSAILLATSLVAAAWIGACGKDECPVAPAPPPVPPSIADLHVTAISATSASLKWTVPKRADSTAISPIAYELRYSRSLEDAWEEMRPAMPPPPSATTWQVDSLQPDESYVVRLAYLSADSVWSPPSNPVSFRTSKLVSLVWFSRAHLLVPDRDDTIAIVVKREPYVERSTAVAIDVLGGSAVQGIDFVMNDPTVLTFDPPATADTTFLVILRNPNATGDRTIELGLVPDETTRLSEPSRLVIEILDADPLVTWLTPSLDAPESSGIAWLRVGRFGNRETMLRLAFRLLEDTATPGEDFLAALDTIELQPRQDLYDIPIQIIDDHQLEFEERLRVELEAVGDFVIQDPVATVNIIDDDTVRIGVSPAAIEIPEADTSVAVTLTRYGPGEGPITVGYHTSSGSAFPGSDYVEGTGSVQISQSGDSAVIEIQIIGDDFLEQRREDFSLRMYSEAPIEMEQGEVRITIVDDDTVTVWAEPRDTVVVEGTGEVRFVVHRGGRGEGTVRIHASLFGRTAHVPEDIESWSGAFTFESPGDSAEFHLMIVDDDENEPLEYAVVELRSDPQWVYVLDSLLTVWVEDDDWVSVSPDANRVEAYEDEGEVTLLLRRGGPWSGEIQVRVQTTPGTAIPAIDFTPLDTVVVLHEPGDSAKVVVSLFEDQIVEGSETFGITMQSPDPRVRFPDPTVEVVIHEDDAGIGLEEAYVEASEGDGIVAIPVRRIGGRPGITPSVTWQVSDSTAVGGEDYENDPSTGTVSFGEDQEEALIQIGIIDDERWEDVEEFIVALVETSSDAGLLGLRRTVVRIVDDDQARFIIRPRFSVIQEGDIATLSVQRTGDLESTVRLLAKTNPSREIEPEDFEPFQEELFFAPGDTVEEIVLRSFDDPYPEDAESFFLELVALESDIPVQLPNPAKITIDYNDGVGARVTADTMYVREGDVAVVGIHVVGETSDYEIRIDGTYETVAGTAVAGEDFVPKNGEFSLREHSPSVGIVVQVVADGTPEDDEWFRVVFNVPEAQRGERLETVVWITE
jgi:hypothetical protein